MGPCPVTSMHFWWNWLKSCRGLWDRITCSGDTCGTERARLGPADLHPSFLHPETEILMLNSAEAFPNMGKVKGVGNFSVSAWSFPFRVLYMDGPRDFLCRHICLLLE